MLRVEAQVRCSARVLAGHTVLGPGATRQLPNRRLTVLETGHFAPGTDPRAGPGWRDAVIIRIPASRGEGTRWGYGTLVL